MAVVIILFLETELTSSQAYSNPRARPVPEAVRRRLTTVTSEDQLIRDLEDVLYTGRSAVIRFYADWCPACSNDRPKFMDLINKFPYTNFFRVNIDDHRALASAYGIRNIPTYFVLRRDTAHLTYHNAGDVSKFLVQLRQSRQMRLHRQHQ